MQEMVSDLVIIGGGPGGYVAAIQAAKMGAEVVLVEKDRVGGTCLNHGCIPTKAFVHSAKVYKAMRRAEEYGCRAENIALDMEKVVMRKDRIVDQLVQGILYLLKKNRVKLLNGRGELLDNNTVSVEKDGEEIIIKSEKIIIATGSRSASLSIPGMNLPEVMDSRDALEMTELPERLLIIGAGVIGMEFAFIFNNFGVDVTVIEYLDRILVNTDKDISRRIKSIAQKGGIKIYTSSRVEEISKGPDRGCLVRFDSKGKKEELTANRVLVATGRVPCLEGLGIENTGIELNDDGRGIRVDERMETNVPGVYAIGDVTNRVQLAHVASYQGMVTAKNALGGDLKMDYRIIPNAIFTDPEIAETGISEEEAGKRGLEVEVSRFPFSANGKALTMGETEGFVKLVSEKKSRRLIGASILGVNATDLIAELALAIRNGLNVEAITDTIHAHPTTAEVIFEAALGLSGEAIHLAR
ncbi:MAG: dihydrolipoyl dehydrogenase [Halanaerobiaceae bacterium]|nr:dihydrolipoyl dehydrogenase [Halanaerobiaceae bacterium]